MVEEKMRIPIAQASCPLIVREVKVPFDFTLMRSLCYSYQSLAIYSFPLLF
ncbi:BnaA04g27020D [Brassica napus]|uniref:BnaA04g27020D protein n=1 Tax=Brassica napus TaxID=3708 RepID=A0A078IK52_BRANA|nr:BnaA04g27020D [Brassica napus]